MNPRSHPRHSDVPGKHYRNEGVPAYDRLTGAIREQILSGKLLPGDRLPAESELTSHYQVGRTTAREALRALATQGLVTIKRGVSGGAFVAHPSKELIGESLLMGISLLADGSQLSLADLAEVRDVLEVPAAELAALRRTPDDLAAIRESVEGTTPRDARNMLTTSRDFHARVVQAAHNPLLELFAIPIFRIAAKPVSRVLTERLLNEDSPDEFLNAVDSEHREILAYLEARDQAGAREATRAHLRHLKRYYEAIHLDISNQPHQQ